MESDRTKKQHKIVWDLYEQKVREFGSRACKIPRSVFYQEIADETDYSIVSVRVILTRMAKRNHIRHIQCLKRTEEEMHS